MIYVGMTLYWLVGWAIVIGLMSNAMGLTWWGMLDVSFPRFIELMVGFSVFSQFSDNYTSFRNWLKKRLYDR